jgi:hypothetical protein
MLAAGHKALENMIMIMLMISSQPGRPNTNARTLTISSTSDDQINVMEKTSSNCI